MSRKGNSGMSNNSSGGRSGNSDRSVYDSVRSTLERGRAPTDKMIKEAGIGSTLTFSDPGGDHTYTKISQRQWQYSPSRMPVQDRYSNTIVASRLYNSFTGKYNTPDLLKRIKLK